MDKLERQRISTIKSQFPSGTRVELIKMDDEQAPPKGTAGTVINVDDIGTVHVRWDTGEKLGVIIGEDIIKKDKDEEKILINPFNI